MTDAATPNTDTPAGGAAPAVEPGTKAERPSDVPEKFWDAEAGALRGDEVLKSYLAIESTLGRRFQETGPDVRRRIAEALPEETRATIAAEVRAKLGDDPEFLTPLEEAWKGKHLRQAPEAYEVPSLGEERGFDPEHALYGKAADIAKKHGLDQDSFAEVLGLLVEAQDAQAAVMNGATAEAWKAAVPDLETRASAVNNRIKALAGEHAQALMESVRDPNAFLAMEAVIKAAGPKSLALEGGTSPETVTQAKLDEWMNDPRYWDSTRRDPEFHAMVTKHYGRLYGDRL